MVSGLSGHCTHDQSNGDNAVEGPILVGLDWVRESHCTEGRWQFRFEAYFESGGGRRQPEDPIYAAFFAFTFGSGS